MNWILQTGLSVIKFENGIVFKNYIHASNQVGYFGFENLPVRQQVLLTFITPELIIPNYNTGKTGTTGNSVEGIGSGKIGI